MMCSSLNLNMKERFVDFYQISCHIVSSYLDPRYDLLDDYISKQNIINVFSDFNSEYIKCMNREYEMLSRV